MKIAHLLLSGLWVVSCWQAAEAAKENMDKTELLSKHETVAEFQGVAFKRCLGRTARCPDDCGNSGNFATFKIVEYLNYEKPGKYGDPKSETYRFMTEDNHKKAKVSPEILKAVKSLKEGDRVHLSWDHNYVTKNGSSYPVRPITTLKKFP